MLVWWLSLVLLVQQVLAFPWKLDSIGNRFQKEATHRGLSGFNPRDVDDEGYMRLAACRQDSLYKLMTDPSSSDEARSFCQIYIAVTILAKTTTTPSYTVTIEVDVSGQVQTPVPTASVTSSSSQMFTTAGLVPRVVPDTPLAKALDYPELRISSVCSCLVEPSKVLTTMTDVAPPVFATHFVTVEGPLVTSSASMCNVTAGAGVSGAAAPTGAGSALQGLDGVAGPTGLVSTGWTGWNVSSGVANATQNVGASGTDTASMPLLTGTGVSGSGSGSGWNASAESGIVQPILSTAPFVSATPVPSANSTANATQTAVSGVSGFASPTGGSNATTNGTVSASYCSSQYARGAGTFLARYAIRCGYSFRSLNPTRIESRNSYLECLYSCDTDSRCYSFSFRLAPGAGNCNIYNYYPVPPGMLDDQYDSGSYVVGSNNGQKH